MTLTNTWSLLKVHNNVGSESVWLVCVLCSWKQTGANGRKMLPKAKRLYLFADRSALKLDIVNSEFQRKMLEEGCRNYFVQGDLCPPPPLPISTSSLRTTRATLKNHRWVPSNFFFAVYFDFYSHFDGHDALLHKQTFCEWGGGGFLN